MVSEQFAKLPTVKGVQVRILTSPQIRAWCNGNTSDSKSLDVGSIPTAFARENKLIW